MILVTGATGTVGKEVLRGLPAGSEVRIMVRNPAHDRGAFAMAETVTAETVTGDYADERSLRRVLRGVTKALLVTNDVGAGHDARFLRAARAAGVRHVVKLSAAAVADTGADDPITRWQRASERLLRASGLDWTLLRPRSFMSNTLSWAPSVRSEGVVRALYGTSANACVDPRDVAQVAVRALTEDGHAGAIHTLTGPEAISAVEQTQQLADLLGRRLRFEELTPEQARDGLRGRYPEHVVEGVLGSARRQLAGAKTGVEQTVLEVTGRPARSFREWARAHRAAFAAV
ncbi:NAD(P)H-binding protein [Streptomyces sp. NPDC091268]|uniref:NAD(P)H-binding protein n=1 Tax=Streptomyces sp. NPDC091268 TaxID=3365979 RepID=UPI00381415C0